MIPFRLCWWDNFFFKTQTSAKTETCTKEVINTPQRLHPGQNCQAKPEEQHSPNEALRTGLKQHCLGAACLHMEVCHPRQGNLRSEVGLSKGKKHQLPEQIHSTPTSPRG